MSLIHELLPGVALSVGVIEKSQRADSSVGAYPFRGIDDVTAAYHRPFFEAGLVLHSEVLSHEMRDYTRSDGKAFHQALVLVRYTFEAPDGSRVSVESFGASIDYQDKASGQAMSQALKTALLQAVLSPPGGTDPDARGPYDQGSSESSGAAERAVDGQEFCPGCFLDYGAKIVVDRLSGASKGPEWRCQAPSAKCGGRAKSGGRFYAWSGWHESWVESVEEWAVKADRDVTSVLAAWAEEDTE